jgi:tryptophan 2,3-dioxygenase
MNDLHERITRPSLAECFYRVLERRGLKAPLSSGRRSTQQKKDYEERTRAVLEVLTHFEDRYEEFQLAEALLEHDEYFSLWRSHHIKMVERMVGAKRGTGGSEGIGYLKTTLDKKFFPELWEARTYLDVGHGEGGCPFAH